MSTVIIVGATAGLTVGLSVALGFCFGQLKARAEIRELRDRAHHLEGRLRDADYAADHDNLTGLPNRRLAKRLFNRHRLIGAPMLLALLDLDGFKKVNDAYGHHAGDDLLRTVAERLAPAAQARAGIAARLAGDEFLLLLPGAGTDHIRWIDDILEGLSQSTVIRTEDGDTKLTLNASAGVTIFDGALGTFDLLLRQADIAVYQAKERRVRSCTYHTDMRMPRNAGRHGPRLRDDRPAHRRGSDASEATA